MVAKMGFNSTPSKSSRRMLTWRDHGAIRSLLWHSKAYTCVDLHASKLEITEHHAKSVSWESGSWNTCNVASNLLTSTWLAGTAVQCYIELRLIYGNMDFSWFFRYNIYVVPEKSKFCKPSGTLLLPVQDKLRGAKNTGKVHPLIWTKNERIWTLLAVLLNLFSCSGAQAALRLSWDTGDVQSPRFLDFRPSRCWEWCPHCSSGKKRSKNRSRSRPAATGTDQIQTKQIE